MRKLLKRLHQSLPEIWKEQRRPSKQINMLHTSAVLLSLSIWIWLHGDGQGPAFWPAFSCVLAIGSTMYQLCAPHLPVRAREPGREMQGIMALQLPYLQEVVANTWASRRLPEFEFRQVVLQGIKTSSQFRNRLHNPLLHVILLIFLLCCCLAVLGELLLRRFSGAGILDFFSAGWLAALAILLPQFSAWTAVGLLRGSNEAGMLIPVLIPLLAALQRGGSLAAWRSQLLDGLELETEDRELDTAALATVTAASPASAGDLSPSSEIPPVQGRLEELNGILRGLLPGLRGLAIANGGLALLSLLFLIAMGLRWTAQGWLGPWGAGIGILLLILSQGGISVFQLQESFRPDKVRDIVLRLLNCIDNPPRSVPAIDNLERLLIPQLSRSGSRGDVLRMLLEPDFSRTGRPQRVIFGFWQLIGAAWIVLVWAAFFRVDRSAELFVPCCLLLAILPVLVHYSSMARSLHLRTGRVLAQSRQLHAEIANGEFATEAQDDPNGYDVPEDEPEAESRTSEQRNLQSMLQASRQRMDTEERLSISSLLAADMQPEEGFLASWINVMILIFAWGGVPIVIFAKLSSGVAEAVTADILTMSLFYLAITCTLVWKLRREASAWKQSVLDWLAAEQVLLRLFGGELSRQQVLDSCPVALRHFHALPRAESGAARELRDTAVAIVYDYSWFRNSRQNYLRPEYCCLPLGMLGFVMPYIGFQLGGWTQVILVLLSTASGLCYYFIRRRRRDIRDIVRQQLLEILDDGED